MFRAATNDQCVAFVLSEVAYQDNLDSFRHWLYDPLLIRENIIKRVGFPGRCYNQVLLMLY